MNCGAFKTATSGKECDYALSDSSKEFHSEITDIKLRKVTFKRLSCFIPFFLSGNYLCTSRSEKDKGEGKKKEKKFIFPCLKTVKAKYFICVKCFGSLNC